MSKGAGEPVASELALKTLARRFAVERRELRTVADTIEIAVMEQLRTERQQRGTGRGAARLGLRIREPRRAGGSFTIEWFQVQRRGRTQYIPRGPADGYPRAAFSGALPWERGIAMDAEQALGQIRRRLRLMKDIERRVSGFAALAMTPVTSFQERQPRDTTDGSSRS